ncbi:MAG: pyridoxal phosphate-dependent aminotransferase [Acidobacteria bacterium]|nr:pyridoxal phosphate-dependent aminotransferase [Acidobacteriota bacterium]
MSFSRRSAFEEKLNRLSQLLREKRASGATVLDLTESNPTRVGLHYPNDLLAPLADSSCRYYNPEPAGLLEARRAVSDYYLEKGLRIPPNHIFLAAGTSEAYSWVFKLLADPSDRVLVPRPSYPLLDYLGALESVKVDRYRLHYDGQWQIDMDSLERSITAKTRAVVCINPNNPTGSFLAESEWSRLSGICARHSMALVVDEVFSDFRLGPPRARRPHSRRRRIQSVAGRHECLNFVLSGLSKVLCLPQMKLAWVAVQGPARERNLACKRLELIADTFLSVNTPAQQATARWLARRGEIQLQVLQRARRNLTFLKAETEDSSCSVLDVEGGWYAILQIPGTMTEEAWVLSLLDKADVLVHPGYFFDFEREAFLVVSLLPDSALFEAAVRRLLGRITVR